jgi:hypothetical protein
MSEFKEKILMLLTNRSSKNPITKTDLSIQAKLSNGMLDTLLDELCASNLINTCILTRKGKTDTLYWRTGCVKELVYGEHYSNQTHLLMERKANDRKMVNFDHQSI